MLKNVIGKIKSGFFFTLTKVRNAILGPRPLTMPILTPTLGHVQIPNILIFGPAVWSPEAIF